VFEIFGPAVLWTGWRARDARTLAVVATRIVQVTTTTDSSDEAAELARAAVAERLAACAQVEGPVTSTYWWEGEVTTDQEYRIAFKTDAEHAPALVAHLEVAHSYDTPEILVTPVDGGHQPYLDWVASETASQRGDP
jgi:periplasmic divalent cation tolerance protein